MSRKKGANKGGRGVYRHREDSRLRTHEPVFGSGRSNPSSFLDLIASGLFGFNLGFLGAHDANLEDDIIYSDSDEEEERNAAQSPLAPHPRIRQLTPEEADQHAKDLLEEEERRKDKAEKKKCKKLRKKERKRLEKENAAKEMVPDEGSGKSESSKNRGGSPIIESNVEAKDSAVSAPGETQSGPVVTRCDDGSGSKEGDNVKRNEEGDGEPKKTMAVNVEDFDRRSRELAGIGNRLAASGQFEMAVKCFTDAIKYNPKELKLFGNRSLCYERLQQYENALMDADLALSMAPDWIKGLFRKGKALCGLKRYYEASLIYQEILRLNSSSTEAAQELKRAQTLHLMEMGFTWAQSSEALKTHATLEEAVEALFGGEDRRSPAAALLVGHASKDNASQPMVEDEEGEWILLPTSRPRTPHVKESDAVGPTRPKSQSPTSLLRNGVKPELFPIWVGALTPTVTHAMLHTLFSRAGPVYSIKMLLDHQCAFVHYTRKEDSERAIQFINGMVIEGAPLSVRYPNKIHPELGVSKSAVTEPSLHPVTAQASGKYIKECFFWRTTGCNKQEKCTYRHVPEHKNIDRDKVQM